MVPGAVLDPGARLVDHSDLGPLPVLGGWGRSPTQYGRRLAKTITENTTKPPNLWHQ